MYHVTVHVTYGTVTVFFSNCGITRVCLPPRPVARSLDGRGEEVIDREPRHKSRSLLAQKLQSDFERYFAGEEVEWIYPLDTVSWSPFQRAVWNVLLDIPFGKTLTYKEVARRIDRPLAWRAVGHACACNPIPLIIPCHRVVGYAGKLTGYSSGLEWKKVLLGIEGAERVFAGSKQIGYL